MAVFELIIVLLLAGAALAAWARRVNAPYPALLALAGAALALLPDAPTISLDPELALALFVAPVLLDAAYDASPRDLRREWRAVTSLVLIAVGLTVAAVAIVARWLVPGMPLAAAIALGAIVAPPDAAAATAVLRQLRPPHRVLVILEGESLFNDASALLIYRLAGAAALTGSFAFSNAIPVLVLTAAGSIILATVLSRILLYVVARIRDVATAVIVQFVSTFAVWITAEQLRLSGIITVVVFAILVARKAPDLIPARLRIQSYAVWEVAVFVLNVLAFIIVGLQLKPILSGLAPAERLDYATAAAAVCATVIVVRIAWVMGYAAVARWAGAVRFSLRGALVVAWCGMRGIVTLAAALALPALPHRAFILFTAFCVVLVTLVVQGMTVSPLIRALRLRDDGSVEGEVRLARVETLRAALTAVDASSEQGEPVTFLRRKYAARLTRAESGDAAPERDDGWLDYTAALRQAQAAQRRTLSDLRARGVIGDDAFHRVEEELDWAEVEAETRQQAGEES